MATLEPSLVVSLASDIHILRITMVATISVLTYDYLLTFNREKELIWPSHFSIIKILFLLNRYVPFIAVSGLVHVLIPFNAHAYLQNCVPVFRVFSSFLTAEYVIGGLILYTRAYAVWGRTTTVLFTIIVIVVAVFTPGLYFTGEYLKSATAIDVPIFPTGCLINLDGHIDTFAVISVVVSEVVALLAVVVKAAQMPQSMIMQQILTNGILYFVVILSISAMNMVVLKATSPSICNILTVPQAAVQSICCNRLIFQTKGTSARTQKLRVNAVILPQDSIQTYEFHSNDIEMQLSSR